METKVKDWQGKVWQCSDNDILSEHTAEEQYEEMLSECYQDVNVCGGEYEAGYLLRLVDPVAFRCGFCDWTGEDFEEVEPLDHERYEKSRVWYVRKDNLVEVETEETDIDTALDDFAGCVE